MAGEPHRYRPSALPQSAPGESAEQYQSKLSAWAVSEFENIYRQISQLVDINVETTAPRAPYDGMVRIFYDTGTYGWSPGGTGTGMYVYFGGSWSQIIPL